MFSREPLLKVIILCRKIVGYFTSSSFTLCSGDIKKKL